MPRISQLDATLQSNSPVLANEYVRGDAYPIVMTLLDSAVPRTPTDLTGYLVEAQTTWFLCTVRRSGNSFSISNFTDTTAPVQDMTVEVDSDPTTGITTLQLPDDFFPSDDIDIQIDATSNVPVGVTVVRWEDTEGYKKSLRIVNIVRWG